jgi:penicillin amidase
VIVNHPLSEATLQSVPEAALTGLAFGSGPGVGSNNWVVSGSRTESGMPLLANDMHLSIQMPSIWYEVGLHCQPKGPDCPFNVTGYSFAGAPGVIVGHNDSIAWGVTNLGPDVQDLFIERINPDNPNQYEYQGEWLDMEIVREEIWIAGEDEPVVVNARITRHGPIINDVAGGTEDDWSLGWQPTALSWTALEPGTIFRAVLLIDQASNWEEFRQALNYWSVPSQNFVYADTEGNIGYQMPGRIPIRASGDGSIPSPGWSGDYDWIGYIPFDELPRTFNPPEGFIATANNAVIGPDFPHFISRDWAPGYRAQRIVELLEADSSITPADIQAIHGDNLSVHTRELLPHVLSLSTSEPALVAALELLRDWDGYLTRDSAAAVLSEALNIQLVDHIFGDEVGEQLLRKVRGSASIALVDLLAEETSPWYDDVTTPGVETRDEIMLGALQAALDDLTERLGPDMADWRWGDLHTALFDNQSLGQCGMAPIEALFNRGRVEVDGSGSTVNSTGYSMSNPYEVGGVPSQRMIVDLRDLNSSLSIHTTGQSGHPFHPHYDDMIDPWRNIEYHPMLWERDSVEADAEGILVLTP